MKNLLLVLVLTLGYSITHAQLGQSSKWIIKENASKTFLEHNTEYILYYDQEVDWVFKYFMDKEYEVCYAYFVSVPKDHTRILMEILNAKENNWVRITPFEYMREGDRRVATLEADPSFPNRIFLWNRFMNQKDLDTLTKFTVGQSLPKKKL